VQIIFTAASEIVFVLGDKVLTVMVKKSSISRDITPCNLLKVEAKEIDSAWNLMHVTEKFVIPGGCLSTRNIFFVLHRVFLRCVIWEKQTDERTF
jgi:hypothetical protein